MPSLGKLLVGCVYGVAVLGIACTAYKAQQVFCDPACVREHEEDWPKACNCKYVTSHGKEIPANYPIAKCADDDKRSHCKSRWVEFKGD